MSHWLISCNPSVYRHSDSFRKNGFIDWITLNNFEVGDIVYIYEVMPPRGRGAIVYKTEVVMANLLSSEKIDDSDFWRNGVYPKGYSEHKFSRLKLLSEMESSELTISTLRDYDFTAPQGPGHLLDKKPDLLNHIQTIF
jgi:hypothetical protein